MPLSFTLDHVGPLARSARDCAAVLQAIAGHDAADPTSSARPVPTYADDLDDDIRGVRIAVPETYFYDPVDPQVRTRVEESLAVYRSLGARIVRVTVPALDVADRMASLIAAVEGAALHRRWLETRADEYGPQTRARLLRGLDERAADYVEALRLRGQTLAAFGEAVFARADVLHTPTMPMVAPAIAASDVGANPGFMEYVQRFGHCTRPISYLGLPAISVPAGLTGDGLPCAFQLVARPFDEARLLTLAHAYETTVGRAWRDAPMQARTATGETDRQDGTRSAA
jgi:aspartyl-tRNA(Asn)/glutamyl-tRNA(Gln) amidotransferase subunit A